MTLAFIEFLQQPFDVGIILTEEKHPLRPRDTVA